MKERCGLKNIQHTAEIKDNGEESLHPIHTARQTRHEGPVCVVSGVVV